MKYPGTESASLEFKEKPPKNDQIVKTIIAFCNHGGGKLVLGVRDDGEVVGLSKREASHLVDTAAATIHQAASPPIMADVSAQTLDGNTIVLIEVSPGMSPPYYRSSVGLENGTYVRLGTSTLKADLDMIDELRLRARGLGFDETAFYRAKPDDLDEAKLKAFLIARKNGGKGHPSEEILTAYQAVRKEQNQLYPTVGGLLLFGKNPQRHISEAFIICSHFKGTSGRDVVASTDCEGDLFEQFEAAYDFITSRLYRGFVIRGAKREEKLEIPEIAIREVLLNAIIHRNYHIPAPTKIAIYDDRLEIFSPGSFPRHFDPSKLTLGISVIRNRVLAKAFRERGLVEKMGTGFITLFESYEEEGLDHPQVVEGPGFVKCILPRTRRSVELSNSVDAVVLQLFDVCDQINVTQTMQALKVNRSTAWRHLERLIANGLLRKEGRGRGVRYKRR